MSKKECRKHTEETKARIASDSADRQNIREKLTLSIDPKQMKEFEASWPEGFPGTIKRRVKTVAETNKKCIKVGSKKDSGD